MKRHQIVWLVAVALLVLAPVQAEATSHSLAALCHKINCPGLLFFTPKIDQVLQAEITPGGYVTIKGSGFGNVEGELYLTGIKHYSGSWVPHITLTIPKGPGWDFWTPTQVVGFLGENLHNVTDQEVKLQIKTKYNVPSNEITVHFRATRDIKVLTASDVQVTKSSCSDEADLDKCNNVKHENFIIFCNGPFDSVGGVTFYGLHWTCVGDSYGDDSFRFSLRDKYGWSLYSAPLDYTAGGVDPPVTTSGPQDWGVTYTKVSVHWNNAPVSYVLYGLNVSIVGPKGVPHY